MTARKRLPDHATDARITAEWLASVGFKWHQFDRQPDKQWLLWLGNALHGKSYSSYDDLGVELAPNSDGFWHCWVRADYAGRYSRFLHVRYLRTRADLDRLIGGLTGRDWVPGDALGGILNTPERAAHLRAEEERLDRVLVREGRKHHDHEEDPLRARPVPMDLETRKEEKAK